MNVYYSINTTRFRPTIEIVIAIEPLTEPMTTTPTHNPIHALVDTPLPKPKTPPLMNKVISNVGGGSQTPHNTNVKINYILCIKTFLKPHTRGAKC
jgi:hypothetical protein